MINRDTMRESKLSDLFNMYMGKTPDRNNPEYWENGSYPWISIADMTSNGKYITHTKECITKYATERSGIKSVSYNTVIMSFKLSVGKVAKVAVGYDNKAFTNEAIMAFEIPDVTVGVTMLSNDYAYYLLQSLDFSNVGNKAVMGKTLNKSILENTVVKYHIHLEKQGEIVRNLELMDDLIEKRKQQLSKFDELVKARFVEMFGDPIQNPRHWKTDVTGKHIDLLSGFPFDSSQYTDSGVNICGGLIIMPQRIDWHDCKHWRSVDGYEEYILQENDIVIALDRPWISEGFKIAMVDVNHLPALLIQRTARVRATDINQRYLMACFILGGFDAHCNVTGSLVPHISAKDIRSFSIMLPPIELQNEFAAFVEQTDKLKFEIKQSLEKLETLKKSLMQKYFG